MPSTVANTYDDVKFDLTYFESIFAFEAVEEITKTSQAIFGSHLDFVATGLSSLVDEADLESSIEFVALGFLNAEPNITDELHFETGLEFVAVDATFSESLALFDAHFDFQAVEQITTAEESVLTLIVDIEPAVTSTGNYLRQKGRLKVDGVEIPYVTATYSEPDARSGSELTVQLARLSDKDLITNDSVIEFAIGDLSGGVWSNVNTIFNTASGSGVDKTSYALSYKDNAPADTFSFSSVSEFSRRFSKSPTRNLVLYDPLKVTLSASDFEPIYDTAGHRYDVELVAVNGLSFYSMLTLVVKDRCGFTSVNTDILDFPIDRVDCPIGQSFMQSIAGYFGMYEPDVYETDPGVLWIEDSSNQLPVGFPTPRSIEIESWSVAQRSSKQQRVDGLLVAYKQNAKDFDYTTSRSVVTIEETGDFFSDNYSSTNREKFFTEYRRFSQPTLVLATTLDRETTQTTNRYANIIAESNEVFTYDEQGRKTRRVKEQSAIVPVLPSSSPAYVFVPVLNEDERFEYKQVPFRIKESYLAKRTLDVSGTTIYDPDNKQLDKTYRQSIIDSLRSGNMTKTSVIETGAAIKSLVETAEPDASGVVTVTLLEIDHLNGVQSYSSNEDRAGDIGLQTIASKQNVVLVFDSEIVTPSFDRIESFSAGELGIKDAVALARRILIKRRTKPNTLNFIKIGFSPTIRKGSVRTINERGTSPVRTLGVYKIKSRSITSNRNGVLTSFTGRQV